MKPKIHKKQVSLGKNSTNWASSCKSTASVVLKWLLHRIVCGMRYISSIRISDIWFLFRLPRVTNQLPTSAAGEDPRPRPRYPRALSGSTFVWRLEFNGPAASNFRKFKWLGWKISGVTLETQSSMLGLNLLISRRLERAHMGIGYSFIIFLRHVFMHFAIHLHFLPWVAFDSRWLNGSQDVNFMNVYKKATE